MATPDKREGGHALEVRKAPPRAKLARSLETASHRDFLHVDGKGRVRSPVRFRVLQGLYYGALAALLVTAFVVYGQVLGPFGVGVAVLLSGWAVYVVRQHFALQLGMRLFRVDRFDEAAETLLRVTTRPLVPRKLRALAEQNLAACRTVQGRHQEALDLLRKATVRWRRSRKLFPMLCRYGEVNALIHNGELAAARSRWAEIGGAPEGEYLQVHHFTAELYLGLAEGAHDIGEEELHRRARFALGITSAASLLGLLAWAFAKLGVVDMSQHLLRESLDRHPGPRLSAGMPLLQKWLDEAAAGLPATE